MDQVRSAIRALEILELLAGRQEGLLMIEISKELEIPPSTLHSILNSLVFKDYICRDPQSMRYHLGWKITNLSSQLHQGDPTIKIALPVINDKIRRRCEETVTMTILDERDIVFIYVSQGISKDLQVVNTVGQRLPAYATGSGRALLAYLPEGALNRIYPEDTFQRLTHKTKTTKKELLEDMNHIREVGYIYDAEESEYGVWAVCGCIRGPQNRPVAGMSIVAPCVRVNEKNKAEWTRILVETIEEISRRLG